MVWGNDLSIFLFKPRTTLKHPSLAPLMKQLQWEADYSQSLKSMSVCYKCAFRKIATNDHTLHLALNQPALIWVRVAHTQVQAVSNTMIICCLTKDRLSPGDSEESVLGFKSGGISLPLTDCVPLASPLCGPASSSPNKMVSRVPPAFRVHGIMPRRIILRHAVTRVVSGLF